MLHTTNFHNLKTCLGQQRGKLNKLPVLIFFACRSTERIFFIFSLTFSLLKKSPTCIAFWNTLRSYYWRHSLGENFIVANLIGEKDYKDLCDIASVQVSNYDSQFTLPTNLAVEYETELFYKLVNSWMIFNIIINWPCNVWFSNKKRQAP